MKCNKICITDVPEEEEGEQGIENLLEEKFSNLGNKSPGITESQTR